MTTQKKIRPEKIVNKMATEKLRSANPELASSAHFPTDSNPEPSQGTTCHTSRIESNGEWLKSGKKFEMEPWLAPASAKISTRVRKVKDAVLITRALVGIPQ